MTQEAERTLSGGRYLRAVSLDLRGVIPTAEEYAQLDADGEIPEDLLDSWLDSDGFVERVVRFHRQFFWNNLDAIELSAFDSRVYVDGEGITWAPGLSWKYGRDPAASSSSAATSCGDFEAIFDEDGEIVPVVGADGYVQEGWVETRYYTDPDTVIRVCAYDAQEAEISPSGNLCSSDAGMSDPDCGCGPELSYCGGYRTWDNALWGFEEDLDRRVAAIISEDRPYTDLLLGKTAWVNGPIVHFTRYNSNYISYGVRTEIPYPADRLPDLHYTDDQTWVEIELGDEQSGLLTSVAFLMRFGSNRARTNKLYNDFYCQPFQTPDGGLDFGNDDDPLTADLTARASCEYCHALIEPAAATWGRWNESGIAYLDPDDFPAYSEECATCGLDEDHPCGDDCRRYYVYAPTVEEEPWLGWLQAYTYLEERHEHHVDEGPRLLVEAGIADGRIPRCVAEKAAIHHLGRQIDEAEDGEWLDVLAEDLVAADWDYKSLIKAIVTSPAYRRLP